MPCNKTCRSQHQYNPTSLLGPACCCIFKEPKTHFLNFPESKPTSTEKVGSAAPRPNVAKVRTRVLCVRIKVQVASLSSSQPVICNSSVKAGCTSNGVYSSEVVIFESDWRRIGDMLNVQRQAQQYSMCADSASNHDSELKSKPSHFACADRTTGKAHKVLMFTVICICYITAMITCKISAKLQHMPTF